MVDVFIKAWSFQVVYYECFTTHIGTRAFFDKRTMYWHKEKQKLFDSTQILYKFETYYS